MTEATLQKKIVNFLKQQPETFAVKIHGGPYQASGLPDVVCCYGGIFVGLEVKLPGKEKTLTRKQALALKRIKDAGGYSGMVTSVDEVQAILEETWD